MALAWWGEELTRAAPIDASSQEPTVQKLAVLLNCILSEVIRMANEADDLNKQVDSLKSVVVAAKALIDTLNKPAIDPAAVTQATANLKTVTDDFASFVASRAAMNQPTTPST